METRDKIILVILVYLSILALYKEREMLGCDDKSVIDVFTSNPPCNNSNNQLSRLIRTEKPKDFFTVYNRVVIWRRSFLLSLLIIIVYHNVMNCPFDGIKMLISVLTGTFFIYFSYNFYKYHLYDYIEEEVKKTYNISLK